MPLLTLAAIVGAAAAVTAAGVALERLLDPTAGARRADRYARAQARRQHQRADRAAARARAGLSR